MPHPIIQIPFKKLSPLAITPFYNYDRDSGADLYSIEEVVIYPHQQVRVKTGLSFQIPDGYEIQVRSKSGLTWNNRLVVANSPATIDCSFSGELEVILLNNGFEDYLVIKPGQKIAQMIVAPIVQGEFLEIGEGELKVDYRNKRVLYKIRGSNGFGSTGIR